MYVLNASKVGGLQLKFPEKGTLDAKPIQPKIISINRVYEKGKQFYDIYKAFWKLP